MRGNGTAAVGAKAPGPRAFRRKFRKNSGRRGSVRTQERWPVSAPAWPSRCCAATRFPGFRIHPTPMLNEHRCGWVPFRIQLSAKGEKQVPFRKRQARVERTVRRVNRESKANARGDFGLRLHRNLLPHDEYCARGSSGMLKACGSRGEKAGKCRETGASQKGCLAQVGTQRLRFTAERPASSSRFAPG